MAKYVVSSTLSDPEWNNSTVIAPDEIAAAVTRLKDEVDGDILVNGSVQLVEALFEEGLVDEVRLMVFPTVVGGGKRAFGTTSSQRELKLTESKAVGPDGVVILTYEPK
jgi:dihydrofolate reductase